MMDWYALYALTWSPRRTKIRARTSPGVAIPWPAAPPMPMARSTLFTVHLLSERFDDSPLEPSCAGARQSCSVRWLRSRSAQTLRESVLEHLGTSGNGWKWLIVMRLEGTGTPPPTPENPRPPPSSDRVL